MFLINLIKRHNVSDIQISIQVPVFMCTGTHNNLD